MTEPIMTIISNCSALRAKAAMAALILASLPVGGCDHLLGDRVGEQHAATVVLDPSQRHPILVSQQPHKMTVRVARGDHGLSPAQRASVIDFLTRFKVADGGNSKLVISVPSGSANEISAMKAVADMRPILADAGFSESSVSIQPYYAENDPQPPVRVSYVRYVAEGPVCGQWPTNVADTSRNLNYEDFGCAQQRNLAAMVANPADLLGPRTMTPADANRRDDTYGKYIKGDPSGTSRTNDERAAN
jgi:pilus assembly protein CpaD